MLPISINVPEEFLKEQDRGGYTVTEKMKKVWAVQLDLLAQMDDLCRQLGLKYFADSGTLIGAVRDGGYIPWDDDIDLAMLRADYDVFVKEAPKRLRTPYMLQNPYTDRFVRGFSRLRNSETTAITINDLFVPCNKGIFIDIFPVDNVPGRGIKDSWWIRSAKASLNMLRVGYCMKPGHYASPASKAVCALLNAYYKVRGPQKAYAAFEKKMRKYVGEKTELVSYVSNAMGRNNTFWKREDFSDVIMTPFEFTRIPIPVGYDERLRAEYGDYMTPVKAPTTHGTTLLDPETAYTVYEQKYTQEQLKDMIRAL